MRASYVNSARQRPQEAARATPTPEPGKPSTLEIARLALIQGLENGASLEMLFACAAETIAILTHDDELRKMVRKRAGVKPYIGTQK